MKLTSLLITLTCFSIVSFSQSQDVSAIMKGNKVIGGGINLSFSDEEFKPDIFDPDRRQATDYSTFSFRPYAGKFIKDRLLVGGRLLITSSDTESVSAEPDILRNIESDEFTIGFGVFLRKYYPIVGKFGAFVETGAGFNFLNNDARNSTFNTTGQELVSEFSTEREGFEISAEIDLGLYVFLGERFSLETSLGNIAFRHSRTEEERTDLFQNLVLEDSFERDGFDFNLVNQISFDQLITVNYFF